MNGFRSAITIPRIVLSAAVLFAALVLAGMAGMLVRGSAAPEPASTVSSQSSRDPSTGIVTPFYCPFWPAL
jgi:hypothetical protein